MSDPKDRSRFVLLRHAVYSDLGLAESLLKEDPSLVHATNGTGETVLHYIAIENGLEEVAWLIAHGADVNAKDEFDETPLMSAAVLDHYKMCKLLLEHGADISIRDHIDDSALSKAAQNIVSETADTATLELLLSHLGDYDINSFFEDFHLEMIQSHAHPNVQKVLTSFGLRAYTQTDETE